MSYELQNPRNVPDVFTCFDGTKVTTAEMWKEKRRPELLEAFAREAYGRIPDLENMKFQIRLRDSRCDRFTMNGRAIRRTVEVEAIRGENAFSFDFVVFIPADAKNPVPCFVSIVNRGITDSDPGREALSSFYPAEQLIGRGYACAAIRTQEIAPDYDEGFTTRFHRLFPEYVTDRPADMCGAISVWSWAASRVMDYLGTDPLIDETRVAIVGHSRGGKTALWTGAQDQRFSLVCSSCAGNSGDAIARGNKGETIADITGRFPFWFCRNYQKYRNNEEAMPFDQHMLLAMIAPRPLYISCRTHDAWADPEGEFESIRQATPVYELLGQKGISTFEQPLPEHPLQDGRIAFHQKTGPHNLDEYDWNLYMDYADKIF